MKLIIINFLNIFFYYIFINSNIFVYYFNNCFFLSLVPWTLWISWKMTYNQVPKSNSDWWDIKYSITIFTPYIVDILTWLFYFKCIHPVHYYINNAWCLLTMKCSAWMILKCICTVIILNIFSITDPNEEVNWKVWLNVLGNQTDWQGE